MAHRWRGARRLGPSGESRWRIQVRETTCCRRLYPAATTTHSNLVLLALHQSVRSYRLCPQSSLLTEDCFQRHPLEFVGNTTDIVSATGTVLHTIPAARTTVGTTPPGSEWTRNPIPDRHDLGVPPNFPPPVPGLARHCCDEGCADGCANSRDGFGQIVSKLRCNTL